MGWHSEIISRKNWLLLELSSGRRVRMTFEWRSKKSFMGRFGGGWNWKVGIDVGSTTVIFNLLVFYIRIDCGAGK